MLRAICGILFAGAAYLLLTSESPALSYEILCLGRVDPAVKDGPPIDAQRQMEACSRTLSELGPDSPARPIFLTQRAFQFMRLGDFAAARADLHALPEEDQSSQLVRLLLSMLGDSGEAMPWQLDYNSALEACKSWADAERSLGACDRLVDLSADSKSDLAVALKVRAMTKSELGLVNEALSDVEAFQGLIARQRDATDLRASILWNAGRYDEVSAILGAMTDGMTDLQLGWSAILAYRDGRFTAATEAFKTLQTIEMYSGRAAFWLAIMQSELQSDPMTPFETVKLTSEEVPLGPALIAVRRGEMTPSALVKAVGELLPVEQHQASCEMGFTLGHIAAFTGRKQDALELLTAAVETCPRGAFERVAAIGVLKLLNEP